MEKIHNYTDFSPTYLFLNHLLTIPHTPLCPFGSTTLLQRGHSTGAEKIVAAHSMSGATNVLPQCGQVTMISPLTIVRAFEVQRFLRTALEEDTSGGDCDGSEEELHRDSSEFYHRALLFVDEFEQTVNPIIERLADDDTDADSLADRHPAGFDHSVRRLRAEEFFQFLHDALRSISYADKLREADGQNMAVSKKVANKERFRHPFPEIPILPLPEPSSDYPQQPFPALGIHHLPPAGTVHRRGK